MADHGKYDDIIDLPHHVSLTRPRMSMEERAAQFSAFAALSGHDEAIRETGRVTSEKIELDENERDVLDWERAAVFDEKIKAHRESIKRLEEKKAEILRPKKRRSDADIARELIAKAKKSGLSAKDIAEKLGIEIA